MNTYTAPSNGTETSNDAARSIEPQLPRLEKMVLDCLRGWGDDGLTCDTVEMMTALPHQTTSARLNQLAKRKLIRDSGLRRPTRSGRRAVVWVAA